MGQMHEYSAIRLETVTRGVYLGYIGLYRDYTGLYKGYMEIMEKSMETIIILI